MNSSQKCFIIAEAGVNHNGSLELAKKLVDAAIAAGADAVKFQTFKSANLVTHSVDKADYQKQNLGRNGGQLEMLQSLELGFEAFSQLKDYCDQQGILFLSTPFDEESAQFLINDLKMNLIKIPSGETINHPFLKFLARYKTPMILSTGMSSLDEISEAVSVLKAEGVSQITLLQCTTSYPCPYEDVNLRAMETLKKTFDLPVGYSDHTMGIEVAIAAAALGATVIEKHFTLDPTMPGPDHLCSLSPNDLKAMVDAIRHIEAALGNSQKKPSDSELKIRSIVRRSVVTTCDIATGTILTAKHLTLKRAGGDISPKEMAQILNTKLLKDKKEDEPLWWKDVEK